MKAVNIVVFRADINTGAEAVGRVFGSCPGRSDGSWPWTSQEAMAEWVYGPMFENDYYSPECPEEAPGGSWVKVITGTSQREILFSGWDEWWVVFGSSTRAAYLLLDQIEKMADDGEDIRVVCISE